MSYLFIFLYGYYAHLLSATVYNTCSLLLDVGWDVPDDIIGVLFVRLWKAFSGSQKTTYNRRVSGDR